MAFYFFSFLSHMHYHLTKSKWIWTSDYFSCDFHISRCCRRQSRLYLFLNFSTLPPRFINFCCPVKNGWHSEQTSNLISSSVDIVRNELPHAQVTSHSLYSGWIPSFMFFHLFPAQAMPFIFAARPHSIDAIYSTAHIIYHGIDSKTTFF